MLRGALIAFAVLAVATAARRGPQSAASNKTDDGREGSGRCKYVLLLLYWVEIQ